MKGEIVSAPIIVLVGPTAIGKTALSLFLAKRFGCEIVSVDSMQVYRHMDIGTAKASKEERMEVPHHLIDIVDPTENYDAARFAVEALNAIRQIIGRGGIPLITGGTGLYLRALVNGIFAGVPVNRKIRAELLHRLSVEGGYKLHKELSSIDYTSAKRIQMNDTQRVVRALEIFYTSGVTWSEHLKEQQRQKPSISFSKLLQIGLTCDRQHLYNRINLRCQKMIDDGLEGEVRKLMSMGYSKSLKPFGAIGYRHMISYLEGELNFDEMVSTLARDTRRYAKRQYTWFSKIEDLLWFETGDQSQIAQLVDKWLTSEC
ncbi:MAG: tRNA (adenosine(37)-N6)-dimethylallyltransferase MiaA [Desulforhopalus sp.]|nr:tRNA (adenosine(37)-N6)-dimethylallyltransferase MiaA [Desulforhopalus sp.]